MTIVRAKLVSTEGTYLEAILEIDGCRYCVMDEMTLDVKTMPKVDESFDFEFCNAIDRDEPWESMFQSNPQKKKSIENIKGWRYRAYGEIISINPVKVDCGILVQPDVLYTSDSKVIGEHVAFTITRLSGYALQ